MLRKVILYGILKVNLTSVLGFYKTFLYMETTLKVWWQRLHVPGNNHIHGKTVTIFKSALSLHLNIERLFELWISCGISLQSCIADKNDV